MVLEIEGGEVGIEASFHTQINDVYILSPVNFFFSISLYYFQVFK